MVFMVLGRRFIFITLALGVVQGKISCWHPEGCKFKSKECSEPLLGFCAWMRFKLSYNVGSEPEHEK